MPELPDVEIYKRYIDATSLHQQIQGIRLKNEKIIRGGGTQAFCENLSGRRFVSAFRHGKHLFLETDGDFWLHLHFGMTGDIRYFKDPEKEPDYTRILFGLERGSLAYISRRMLGFASLIKSPGTFIDDQNLGPDARGLSLEKFKERLSGRGKLKSRLMDQRVIAGLGNIYTDEVLFQAQLHPEMPIGELSKDQFKTLHRVMGRVLEEAIDRKADPGQFPDSWLIHARKSGADCPKGSGRIEKITVNGRGTYFCPDRQPPPAAG